MYTKILVALDVERPSDGPIISADRLAREQRAELYAVSVVRPALLSGRGFFSADVVDRDGLIEEARGALKSRIAATCSTEYGMDVVVGKPSDAIVAVAQRRGSQLIVLGANPRKGSEIILGTTATNILRKAAGVSVYACHRSDPQTSCERITVAIGGSELSGEVLSNAQEFVSALEQIHKACEIQVVCVVRGTGSQSEPIVSAASKYLTNTGWRELHVYVETGGIVGGLERAIRDFDSDLLIVGSGHDTGLVWPLGSTTNSLLHEVSCDVLVTRPKLPR